MLVAFVWTNWGLRRLLSKVPTGAKYSVRAERGLLGLRWLVFVTWS